jgi:outer membrane protein
MEAKTQLAKKRVLSLTWLFGLAALPVTFAHTAELHLADAIELALAKNPDIVVQRYQANSIRGLEMQAKAQFDWALAANTYLSREITPFNANDVSADGSPVWDQTRQISAGYQVGVSKQLRNGLIFGTSVVAAGRDTTPGAAVGQQNIVKLNVLLTVPLLRGSGKKNVTAQETAARLAVLASEYTGRNQVAQTIHDVAVAYWTCVSRIALEQIAFDAEQRSENLLRSIQKLVDKAEKPRADLVLVEADHADKVVTRKAAALSSLNAKNSLGRVLGIDATAITQLSVTPGAIPTAQFVPAISERQISALGTKALQRRPDLSALNLQMEAATELLAVARDKLKPQVDLQLGASYGKASVGGSHFGFINMPGRTQTGPSVSTLLSFQFPIENNYASGALAQSGAAVDQLAIRIRDLRIAIVNSVEAAAAAVSSSAERTQIAKDGLALYQQAIEHEVIKQRNGISTLIDVINVESKYVGSRVNHLEVELEYAIAMANLKLAAGTLLPEVAPGDSALDRITIDVDALQGQGK